MQAPKSQKTVPQPDPALRCRTADTCCMNALYPFASPSAPSPLRGEGRGEANSVHTVATNLSTYPCPDVIQVGGEANSVHTVATAGVSLSYPLPL